MKIKLNALSVLLLLVFCAKSIAQDEIFISGFEAVPILQLEAAPESIAPGELTTLTWTINDADECEKLGDWTGFAMSGTGVFNEVVFPISLPAIYSMQCSNQYGNSPIRTVVIENSAVWPSCAGESAAILDSNEDRSILAQGLISQPTNYNGLYEDIYNNSGGSDSNPWPGSLGASIRLNIEKNHYVAAKFTTPSESIDAKFLSQIPSNNEGVPPSGYTISISECPGDFSVHLNQPACINNQASFKWSTTPNPPGPNGFFCELEKNKTYYLNIVHSTSEENNYQTTACLSQNNSCGHLSTQSLVIIR